MMDVVDAAIHYENKYDSEMKKNKKLRNKLTALRSQVEKMKKESEIYKTEAERLFGLLDDIDTAEDIFQPKITPHFDYVHKKHRERFGIITHESAGTQRSAGVTG